MFFMQTAAPSTMGMSLFYTLSSFTFFYCAMSGIWVTSDCISEEKGEGTLGLLFLTDLKGYDVVFGKLAATWGNGAWLRHTTNAHDGQGAHMVANAWRRAAVHSSARPWGVMSACYMLYTTGSVVRV